MSFHHILVALDDSELASRVFKVAVGLAQQNDGVLHLLHCVSEMLLTPMPLDIGVSPALVSSAYEVQQIQKERNIEQAKKLLESFYKEAIGYNVKTEWNYALGEPGNKICEVAHQIPADLIIIGRRGRTGLTEVLLGSVSNYVVHHAGCCVLVIQ